jgi:hypothetical protein
VTWCSAPSSLVCMSFGHLAAFCVSNVFFGKLGSSFCKVSQTLFDVLSESAGLEPIAHFIVHFEIVGWHLVAVMSICFSACLMSVLQYSHLLYQ